MPSQKREHDKILIVEGADDRHAVIGLMQHHCEWPNDAPYPVWVEIGRSVDEILAKGYLTSEIKSPNTRVLGVVLDADEHAFGRYQRVRQLCTELFPSLPETISPSGVIVENTDQKRLGLWVMPDNEATGDFETLLRYLVPSENEKLWQHSVSSVEKAQAMGASCTTHHNSKAQLYTWLAWQDPPGQSPGLALTKKVLDPNASSAEPFVTWFRNLFQL